MFETSEKSLASYKPLRQPEVEVPVLIESSTKDFELGMQFNSVEDPTDPTYCFITPKIFIKHQKERLPREVILLIDVSYSMWGDGIDGIKTILPKIFDCLLEGDRITIKTFSRILGEKITRTKSGLPNDFKEISDSIQPSEFYEKSGDTALYDVILSVAEERDDIQDTGRATVLLFSDGLDSASKFKGTPAELLQQYDKAFEGKPPRFFPIGLGPAYDHEFFKKCAIATNFGMIDARDMTKLDDHIGHIINGLVCGVHATIEIADSGPINLGILNFNTENTLDPIRVSKKSIEKNHLVGSITLAGEISKLSAPIEIKLSSKEEEEVIDRVVTKRAKEIYDDYGLNFDQKMTGIEELLNDFRGQLSATVCQSSEDLLRTIELKSINGQVEEKIFQLNSHGRWLKNEWNSEENLEELQRIEAKYPENKKYLDEIIRYVSSDDAKELVKSLRSYTASRTPNNILDLVMIKDNSLVNCYINTTSSITSKPFTANLSTSANYPDSARPLNRVLNFATVNGDKIIKSSFKGRESVSLDLNSKQMQQLRDELIQEIGEEKELDVIIRILIGFVNKKFSSNEFKADKSSFDLEEIIAGGKGVCRHHSLFTAYLLGELVKQEKLPSAGVNHYRAATNQLTAHSFVVYTQDNNFTIVDSAQRISFAIRNQADFEACVKLYNDKGLHWILRNFAKDKGFSYPADEDNLALGQTAIDRLAANAEYNPVLATKIRELGLRCAVSGLIMSNPMKTDIGISVENSEKIFEIRKFRGFKSWEPDLDKKIALWDLLVENNCILPEENCLGGKFQKGEDTAKELRHQNINTALDREAPRNKLLTIIETIQKNILTEQNGRWTSRNGQWKVDLLEGIAQNLRENPRANIQQCISNTLEVCKQGRNTWHFWAEPHSVSEFKSALAEAGLGLEEVSERRGLII